ncbi:hypothetical protein [Bacillus sp. REN10]|uniref:hypothetical protein n=1 Tax=Bacillus sp. REN10 TaxID=2782541 RepID=UPI00193C7778|nr:hypothetical protein [Bacillus sp. REN10]
MEVADQSRIGCNRSGSVDNQSRIHSNRSAMQANQSRIHHNQSAHETKYTHTSFDASYKRYSFEYRQSIPLR